MHAQIFQGTGTWECKSNPGIGGMAVRIPQLFHVLYGRLCKSQSLPYRFSHVFGLVLLGSSARGRQKHWRWLLKVQNQAGSTYQRLDPNFRGAVPKRKNPAPLLYTHTNENTPRISDRSHFMQGLNGQIRRDQNRKGARQRSENCSSRDVLVGEVGRLRSPR